MAWEIGPGDAVFVPDFTFFSSGECPAYEGATPIFVDVKRGVCGMKDLCRRFFYEETAVGVVEMILILVVLIGLVIIFKQQLTSIVNSIFKKITSQSNSI